MLILVINTIISLLINIWSFKYRNTIQLFFLFNYIYSVLISFHKKPLTLLTFSSHKQPSIQPFEIKFMDDPDFSQIHFEIRFPAFFVL